ncbi:MAG: 4Fe-4S binding protein [Coriobacteriia bacterium]|nr:4Fe-4S binding protein [Coriobacteriia bacterium]MBS5478548.1 4Fe-4S binding protein [Coriobacteriia bacterium]
MMRTIVHIDEALCNGCGACARACHEGAIAMVGGKARLIRDDYCDGLGDCLPACPAGAISFEEREAAEYDEAAVAAHLAGLAAEGQAGASTISARAGCPGARPRVLRQVGAASRGGGSPSGGARPSVVDPRDFASSPLGWVTSPAAGGDPLGLAGAPDAWECDAATGSPCMQAAPASSLGGSGAPGQLDPRSPAAQAACPSQLAQWPCQIRLAPVSAPYFQGADLLVAADCTAFAYASLHRDFMAGRVTLIGCPKLDAVDYAEKLGAILRANDVRSVTLVRMEVPCCGGLERAVCRAIEAGGRDVPFASVTISCDGRVLEP